MDTKFVQNRDGISCYIKMTKYIFFYLYFSWIVIHPLFLFSVVLSTAFSTTKGVIAFAVIVFSCYNDREKEVEKVVPLIFFSNIVWKMLMSEHFLDIRG